MGKKKKEKEEKWKKRMAAKLLTFFLLLFHLLSSSFIFFHLQLLLLNFFQLLLLNFFQLLSTSSLEPLPSFSWASFNFLRPLLSFFSFFPFFFPPSSSFLMDRAAIDDTSIETSSSASSIPPVLSLSTSLFSRIPGPSDPKFSQLNQWQDKLEAHDGTIFTGCVAGHPVAFVVAFEKAQLVEKVKEEYVKVIRVRGNWTSRLNHSWNLSGFF